MTGISVVVVVRAEAPDRIDRLFHAVASSTGVGDVEVVIAAPQADLNAIIVPEPNGALGAVRLVENPTGERSAGLNLATATATGQYICRLDARSRPPADHLRRCIDALAADPRIAVVGGRQAPVPGSTSALALGIARALRNPWVLGGARYRRPDASGSVDTVYLGSFRRSDLLAIGGWDERLSANEDFDLCARFRADGGVIWLEAGLAVDYEARTSLGALLEQYHAFGRSKVAFWRLGGRRPALRQVVAIAGGIALSIAIATSVVRPRRLGAVVMGGLCAVAVVDHIADPEEPQPAVRAYAIVASVAVVTSWLSGIARALVRGA